ncbi:MAG: magnesium transporter [Bacteroidetes bacterium]|nr:magnesium transporter [Bacteroidota bacterium]
MQFEVTEDFLDKISTAINENNIKWLEKNLKKLQPADIAGILNELNLEDGKKLFNFLEDKIAADALIEMEDDKRERFLDSLTSAQIADHIDHLPSDEAADVISELSDKQQDEVLRELEKEDKAQASDIVDLLKYEEGTAGALMAKELIRVHVNQTVWECVREMRRQAEKIDNIYAVYAVDDDDKLLGILSLKKLITTPLRTKITDAYNPNVISVRTDTPSEEVANIMKKYDFVVLPVIDNLGRLLGRITVDDVMDVMSEEATEDAQKMGGMQALEDPYMSTSVFQMLKKRAGWLVVLFIGESFTATAMSFFENQIAKAVVLALFVPLIISSGGNTGSQASSLIIRAMALGEVSIKEWWRIVRKEIKTGILLGIILGVIGFLRVAIWSAFIDIYGPHWMLVGIAVGISLIGVVLWGNLVGSTFPIFLKRIGLDPAVSSAPFVATFVDVTGLIIYFTVASIILGGILL